MFLQGGWKEIGMRWARSVRRGAGLACAATLVLAGGAAAQDRPRVTQVSARYNHTVLLRSDGRLLACGDNSFGQLGFPSSGNALKASMAGFEGAVAVSTGGGFTVAVRQVDNSVWVWGDNFFGQLGDGRAPSVSVSPVQVVVREGTEGAETHVPLDGVAAVSGGANHAVAVKQDGSVWAWGGNNCGQVGAGPEAAGAAPYATLVPTAFTATAVAAGGDFTLALASDGTVYAWGCNGSGQLGNGSVDESQSPFPAPTPVMVSSTQPLTEVSAIAANGKHALALKADGTVWSWGEHQGFEEGSEAPWSQPYARQVAPLAQMEAVSAGGWHNLALVEATESLPSVLWGWGDAEPAAGKLGDAYMTVSDWWAPVQVIGTAWDISQRIVRIEAGSSHTVALLTDGSVWAWGGNGSGELGDGTTDSRPTPAAVAFAPNLIVQLDGVSLWEGEQIDISEGETVAIGLAAFDAPGAVPTYSVSFDGGSDLPEGASLTVSQDGLTAAFRWTPSYLEVTKGDDAQRRYYPVTFTAMTAGGETAAHSFTLCVVNKPQPPVADAGAEALTAGEGAFVTLDGGASSDPDGGTLAYRWISDTSGLECEPSHEPVCSFTAPAVDSGGLTVTFTLEVTDDDNMTSSAVVVVTVTNNLHPPTASVDPSALSVVSGESFTVQGAGYDEDGSITKAWTRGDGTIVGTDYRLTLRAPYVSEPTSFVYLFTVTDNDGLTATAVATVTVQPPTGWNEPPEVESVQTTALPVRVGEPFTSTATVSDDALGTAPPTVTWTWSDGTEWTDTAPVPAAGSVPVWTSTVERYADQADVYTVTVQAKDSRDALSDPKACDRYVVVYDPEGGFVSGGGTVPSPAGALNGSEAAGQATFGFTAKYHRDTLAPEGTLNFKLPSAGIEFRAESYEWLTVTGARARIRGVGTLATESGPKACRFLLSVNDGKRRGGGGGHKFRLKIWDQSTNAVVYDNQWSSRSELDLPVQPLSGGTIVVQER